MLISRFVGHGCALGLALVALGACSGTGTGFGSFESKPAAPPPPPIAMAGLWTFASPGRGQCRMTFGAASPAATEGTVAPQGGCPGKFYMSRKWSAEAGGIVIRDHNGQPLAELSGEGAQLSGKATSGDAVTLTR